MKGILLLTSFVILSANAYTQLQSHTIYNSKGKKVSYKKMIKSIADDEIVLFGELHNNIISHWYELEILKSLQEENKLGVGLEMFERDNEEMLQAFMKDSIDTKEFDELVRQWNNYPTDYSPILEYCKSDSISFHATNIPRRFANLIYKGDFSSLDTLNNEEKSWVAPLPIVYYDTLPQYKAILEMMGDHGTPSLVKAQAIKDATMAYFALQVLNNENVDQVFHLNGAFHSNYYEGIYWYIKHYSPETSISTLTTVEQENVHKLLEENKGKADFIIVVDKDFPTSY